MLLDPAITIAVKAGNARGQHHAHVFEERHHRLRGAVTGDRIEQQVQAQAAAECDLRDHLVPGDQATGLPAHDFQVIIHEPNGSEAQGYRGSNQDQPVVEPGPQQHRYNAARQDNQTAHGRGARLAEVCRGTFRPNHLAPSPFLDSPQNAGAHHERDDQRGGGRGGGPERQVLEHVQDRPPVSEREKQVIEHLVFPLRAKFSAAGTGLSAAPRSALGIRPALAETLLQSFDYSFQPDAARSLHEDYFVPCRRPQTHPTPVSYTHLTLPTILRV